METGEPGAFGRAEEIGEAGEVAEREDAIDARGKREEGLRGEGVALRDRVREGRGQGRRELPGNVAAHDPARVREGKTRPRGPRRAEVEDAEPARRVARGEGRIADHEPRVGGLPRLHVLDTAQREGLREEHAQERPARAALPGERDARARKLRHGEPGEEQDARHGPAAGDAERAPAVLEGTQARTEGERVAAREQRGVELVRRGELAEPPRRRDDPARLHARPGGMEGQRVQIREAPDPEARERPPHARASTASGVDSRPAAGAAGR